jgi:hypothetical protein
MRGPRIRLRSLMIGIAFLALILTVMMQAVLLQRAVVREEMYRAEAEMHRARAEAEARRLLEYVRAVETLSTGDAPDPKSKAGRK